MLFESLDMTDTLMNMAGNDFNMESQSSKFLSPEEGFLRGNLFANEYDAYKNLTFYKLKPENQKEQLLYKLMAYCFAINDLNLYLDLHPEDMEAFNLFKKYAKERNDIEQKYADIYGPVTVTQTQGQSFNWIKNPWPWDKEGGSKYV